MSVDVTDMSGGRPRKAPNVGEATNFGPAAGHDAYPPELLPRPPTDREYLSYLERHSRLIQRTAFASLGCLTISQIRLVINTPALWPFVPFLFFTLVYFGISLAVNFGSKDFDYTAHRHLVMFWRPDVYPTLDIHLPISGEDLAVLANTWAYVAALIRAYPGTAIAYVLDDGARPEAEQLARGMGPDFVYAVRHNRPWFKKAGNLRYGMAISRGEYILILDADFAPRSDLPQQLLPYLEADPRLAIVQSPQYFRTTRHQSWMERGAGAVQELFYRLVQVSRDRFDGAICVGSCAVYRRAALDQNGGVSLISHSEDVHTGFDLWRLGWSLRYVPLPLATGLSPSDPNSFLAQQYRWCSGSMALLGSAKFWRYNMPWQTRLCYISGFCYYIHTAVFTIVTPVLPIMLLTVSPGRISVENYVLIVPSVVYNLVVFPAWHRCEFRLEAFTAKLLYSWAHVFSLVDVLRGRQQAWQATGEKGRKAGTRRVWAAVWGWSGISSAAWIGLTLWRMAGYGTVNLLGILAMGLMSAATTAMALASGWNHKRRGIPE